ncbi:hypothetical protein ES708_34908 [subsurface metagenome]
MRSADSVTSHFFKNLKLAFNSAGIYSRSQATQIVVITNPFDFNILIVQEESFIFIKSKVPNTKCCFIIIANFPIAFHIRNSLI